MDARHRLAIFPLDFLLTRSKQFRKSDDLAGGKVCPSGLVLTAVLTVLLGAIWFLMIEYYPLTGMPMYSRRNSTPGVVNYQRLFKHYADGRKVRARPEHYIRCLRNGRYKRALGNCFEEGKANICREFLETFGKIHNQSAKDGRITKLEVQEREWDFVNDADNEEYGKVIETVFVNVPDGQSEERVRP